MAHTASLENAKLLKEAGFKQNTIWYWHFKTYGGSHINLHNDGNSCSAPTTDELLEEMNNNHILDYANIHDDENQSMEYLMNLFRDPNKLANCWLYLKKENLI